MVGQSSFYSANDRRLHFGLGAETTVDLAIRWTNGTTETIAKVAADQQFGQDFNCARSQKKRGYCRRSLDYGWAQSVRNRPLQD